MGLHNSFTLLGKGANTATVVVQKLEHQRRRHSSDVDSRVLGDVKPDENDKSGSVASSKAIHAKIALKKKKKNANTGGTRDEADAVTTTPPSTTSAAEDGAARITSKRTPKSGGRRSSLGGNRSSLKKRLIGSFTRRNHSFKNRSSHTSSLTASGSTSTAEHNNSFSSNTANQIKDDDHLNKAPPSSGGGRREAFRERKSFSQQMLSSPSSKAPQQRRRSSLASASNNSSGTDLQQPSSPQSKQAQLVDAKRRDFMLAKRKAHLANVVASVHAKKYINECLFGDADGTNPNDNSVLDRDKWESIPQYSRSDMVVRQHLGKGSFSDVFEVHVIVTNDAIKAPTLKELGSSSSTATGTRKPSRDVTWMMNSLTKKATIPTGAAVKEGGEGDDDEDEDDDMNRQIDAMFGSSLTSLKEDEEGDLSDKAIIPNKNNRRQSLKRNGVNASFCLGHASSRMDTMTAKATTDNEGKAQDSSSTTQSNGSRLPNRRHAMMNGKSVSLSTSLCLRKSTTKRQMTYAMKCLRPQIRSNSDQFIIGVEDLVHETAMLVSLDHPNIIKIHGRAGKDCISNSFCLSDGYFILLDRLQDTLQDRIVDWRNENNANKEASPTSSSRSALSMNQLETSYSIADALAYLHSKSIIFRDLKPANVGFDSMGVVKLFDFGFAIGVGNQWKGDGSTYNKSAQPLDEWCGTPRYMAPEVAMETGYGIPADVHSYGILFWEICALKKPFAHIKSSDELHQCVFVNGARPKVNKSWPKVLKSSMASCWMKAPEERPTMEFMKNIIGAHMREVSSSVKRQRQQQQRGRGSVERSQGRQQRRGSMEKKGQASNDAQGRERGRRNYSTGRRHSSTSLRQSATTISPLLPSSAVTAAGTLSSAAASVGSQRSSILSN